MAAALVLFSLIILLASAAHANGWVPSDSSGNPLQYGDPGYDSENGGAVLLGTGITPIVNPTGTYAQIYSSQEADNWWLEACSYEMYFDDPPPGPDTVGLSVESWADNNAGYAYYGYVSSPPPGYDYTQPDYGPGNPPFPWINGDVDTTENDTMTAHFVWTGPGPAPTSAHFLLIETAGASAQVSYPDGVSSGLTAAATASMGDAQAQAAASSPDAPQASDAQTYRQLITVSPNGNIAAIPVSGSTDANANNSVVGGSWVGGGGAWYYEGPNIANALVNASASGSAVNDDRSATISSNIDPTYHKGTDDDGNPIPVEDAPRPDGTIEANSVKPDPDSSITYYGHAAGSWAAGSSYLMHCSSDGSSTSGTFTLPDDPLCHLDENYDNSATTEHAYLHLTDANDAANATANYYVEFHDPVENMIDEPGSPVHHPLIQVPTPDNYTEWTELGPTQNPYDTSLPDQDFSDSASDQFSVQGTIGATGGVTLSAGEIGAAFSVNKSITIGQQYTASASEGYGPVHYPPHTITYVWWSIPYDYNFGTCDVFGVHGYAGLADWNDSVPQSLPGNVLYVQWSTDSIPM